MNDTQLFIVAILTLIAGIISPLLLLWVKARLEKQNREVHDLINSRMSQLLEVTKSDATAKGKAEGKVEERKEAKQRDK